MNKTLLSTLLVHRYGADILASKGMQSSKRYIQHGTTSVFAHSVGVACCSIRIARALRLHVNERCLVRGALLHDYFLYDWHVPEKTHRLHGFRHPQTALNNACRDFQLHRIERDIIVKHMFPLNLYPPRYRESLIVCIADKLSASIEVMHTIMKKASRFV